MNEDKPQAGIGEQEARWVEAVQRINSTLQIVDFLRKNKIGSWERSVAELMEYVSRLSEDVALEASAEFTKGENEEQMMEESMYGEIDPTPLDDKFPQIG